MYGEEYLTLLQEAYPTIQKQKQTKFEVSLQVVDENQKFFMEELIKDCRNSDVHGSSTTEIPCIYCAKFFKVAGITRHEKFCPEKKKLECESLVLFYPLILM